MALEQTFFPIQRSVFQPEAVPPCFLCTSSLFPAFFIILTVHPAGMSIVLSLSVFSFKMNPLQMEQLRFNDIFIRLCCGLAETNKTYHHYRNAICDMTKTQFIQTVKTNWRALEAFNMKFPENEYALGLSSHQTHHYLYSLFYELIIHIQSYRIEPQHYSFEHRMSHIFRLPYH